MEYSASCPACRSPFPRQQIYKIVGLESDKMSEHERRVWGYLRDRTEFEKGGSARSSAPEVPLEALWTDKISKVSACARIHPGRLNEPF